MIKNVTFGSDIEVLLQDLTGRLFPVCGTVGGTKDKPRSLGKGFYIQEDNVALEFNIPVSKTQDQFMNNVRKGLALCKDELPPSLSYYMGASGSYDPSFIDGIAKAQQFGCDPDFNAWLMVQNEKPTCEDRCFRTAAGHVHIGWDNPEPDDQVALVKWSDVFVSTWSVIALQDRKRRDLYGKAGCFRPKEYGIEHRVLSNDWIWNIQNIGRMYARYQQAIKAVNLGLTFDEADVDRLAKAINTYNVNACDNLYHKYLNRLVEQG